MTFPTEAAAHEFITQFDLADVAIIPTTHQHWVIVPTRVLKRKGAQMCSICQQPFREFSNNAQPVNDGRCCAYCDDHVVTPQRIAMGR